MGSAKDIENQCGGRRQAWWCSNEHLSNPDGKLTALMSKPQAVSPVAGETNNSQVAGGKDAPSGTPGPGLQLPNTDLRESKAMSPLKGEGDAIQDAARRD